MNTLTPLELHEVKKFLQCLKPETILCPGFGTPHPYRGGWTTLGLVPQTTTTVRELLGDIERAQSTKLRFPDGREVDYYYENISPVYIASQNHYGVPLTLEALLMSIEGWVKIGEGFDRTH